MLIFSLDPVKFDGILPENTFPHFRQVTKMSHEKKKMSYRKPFQSQNWIINPVKLILQINSFKTLTFPSKSKY